MFLRVLTEPGWRVTSPQSTSEELPALHCSTKHTVLSTRDQSPGPTCCCRLPAKNTPAAGGTGERHNGHVWNGFVAGAQNGVKETRRAGCMSWGVESAWEPLGKRDRRSKLTNNRNVQLTIPEFIVCLVEIEFRGVSAHRFLLSSNPVRDTGCPDWKLFYRLFQRRIIRVDSSGLVSATFQSFHILCPRPHNNTVLYCRVCAKNSAKLARHSRQRVNIQCNEFCAPVFVNKCIKLQVYTRVCINLYVCISVKCFTYPKGRTCSEGCEENIWI